VVILAAENKLKLKILNLKIFISRTRLPKSCF